MYRLVSDFKGRLAKFNQFSMSRSLIYLYLVLDYAELLRCGYSYSLIRNSWTSACSDSNLLYVGLSALRRVGEERRSGSIASRCLEEPQFDLATTFVEASASPNEQELLMARHTLDRMEMAARRLVDLSTGAQLPIPAQASPQQQLEFDELLANSTVFKKLAAELSAMSVACDEISNDVLSMRHGLSY